MSKNNIAESFCDYLLSLKEDSAAMAELKRGIAFQPGTYTPMFSYIVPFLPEKGNELPFFLTASLFAMHPVSTNEGNLGSSFRELDETESRDLRFRALLKCREEELGIQLRSVISLLASKGIPVNYVELFQAIKYWGSPEKYKQKSMAKSFWASNEENKIINFSLI